MSADLRAKVAELEQERDRWKADYLDAVRIAQQNHPQQLEADLTAAVRAIGAVEALIEREVADDLEAAVRAALGQVRCLDCNLRYAERDEYSCGPGEPGYGRAHDYPDDWLKEAAEKAKAEGVDYITFDVSELREALALGQPEEQQDPRCPICGDALDTAGDALTFTLVDVGDNAVEEARPIGVKIRLGLDCPNCTSHNESVLDEITTIDDIDGYQTVECDCCGLDIEFRVEIEVTRVSPAAPSEEVDRG